MEVQTQMILCAGAMLLAGLVQGSCGFGFGIVGVGLASLIVPDPRVALVFPVLPTFAITTGLFVSMFRHVAWRRIWPFAVAAVCGTPLGVVLLVSMPKAALHTILGALLIVSGVYPFLAWTASRCWHPVYLGAPLGLVSGLFSGAFSSGGPVAIAYVGTQGLERFPYVATLQSTFVLTYAFRILVLGGSGLLTNQVFAFAAAGLPTAALGCLAGVGLLRWLPQRVLRLYVNLFEIALGVSFLFRAWSA